MHPSDTRPAILDHAAITQLLPHRPPFLFVDRIVELDPGKRATGIRLVSADERFLSRDARGQQTLATPILVESLGQVGAVMILADPQHRGKLVFFTGIRKARLRRPVYPGDELVIEVRTERMRGAMGIVRGRAKVAGSLVASGAMSFALGRNDA